MVFNVSLCLLGCRVLLVYDLFCYNGHGSEVPMSLLESTSSLLEFFAIETRPSFDVFVRGYMAKVEDQAHW